MKNTFLIGGAVAASAAILLITSRKSIPAGATAVKPFDVKKYMGDWYEIARMDYRFERNLSNTSAHYTLNDDGSVKVVNRGFDSKQKQWREAKGKAKFAGATDEGKLKVSFFGPFYSGYNVIDIDADYRYALVAGKSLKYLWILSRETTIPENVKQSFLKKAEEIGYETSQLVWVNHALVH
jgi:apolipoprotein D and lipocalin family protein